MALENIGKTKLQAQADTLISKVRLKLEDGNGGQSFSSLYDITFQSPSASLGLRLASSIQIPIDVCDNSSLPACDFTKVLGIQLTNTDGSTIYYDKNFTTPFTFNGDGQFTLSTTTLNFATSGDGSATSTAEQSFANTLDAELDKARLKGLGYVSVEETSPIYTDYVTIISTDITRTGSVLNLNTNKTFNITFNPIYQTMEYDEIEFYNDANELILTAPLDDTYIFNANGTFTLTAFSVTLS